MKTLETTVKSFRAKQFEENIVEGVLLAVPKVIREKSRGKGSLIVQDTIENVSEPKFFFNFLRKKNYIF